MLKADSDSVLLAIRVNPRAPTAKIAGERAGRLLVHVTAPPLEGRANEAACRVLAKSLGIALGRITVVGGERARDKLVRIDGMSAADVARALEIADTAT
jgi:uncharacterized protein